MLLLYRKIIRNDELEIVNKLYDTIISKFVFVIFTMKLYELD